ncbi:MAG: hypothetical protein SGARI_004144, partial [Bacillariaceae sp.]
LGTILELHSLSAEKFNGQLVAFYSVNADNNKWVVKMIDNEKPLAVLPERTRRPAVFDDDATTPAPSLEDLPPEQGTILELFNIGSDEYAGMLVEFRSLDKKNGKYFVDFLDDQDGSKDGMRVKVKCCRRPAIKSLALRKLLAEIILNMAENCKLGREILSKQDSAIILKGLLEVDPCCVPALCELRRVTWEPADDYVVMHTTTDESLKFLRRGVANLWAYEDVLDSEWIGCKESDFSNDLAAMGRHKLAARYRERSDAKQGEMPFYRQMQGRENRVLNLLMSCMALERAKMFHKALDSILRMGEEGLGFLHWIDENGHEIASDARSAEWMEEDVRGMLDWLVENNLEMALDPRSESMGASRAEHYYIRFGDYLSAIHDSLLEEQQEETGIDDINLIRRDPKMVEGWKKALDIANQVLDARTLEDGTIKFADPTVKDALQSLRFKALLEIRHDNEMESASRNRETE